MFIQTETTPNPATLKFLPGCDVMPAGTANFTGPEDARRSPLALRVFEVDGVSGVFLGSDFVTVTKTPDRDWDVMKPMILSSIMEHFTSGDEAVYEHAGAEGAGGGDEAMDGDITFESFEDGIVYLRMQGACSGCPSSTMTLKHGIENMLKYYVPEVLEVRSVEW